jgi:putative NADPH-quinone reductase
VIKGDDYRPGLSGKKGAIITTSGATVEELRSAGTLRALKTIQDEGLMKFCGIELIGHLYLGGIDPTTSRTADERHLDTVRRFVRRAF